MNQARMQALETQIGSLMDSLYVDDKKARLISINVEKLSLLMQKASMNKFSDELTSRIANHEYLDRYMRKLVSTEGE